MRPQKNTQKKPGLLRRSAIGSAALLLLAGMIWNAKESGTRSDAILRSDLTRQVTALAATFPADGAQALSFTRNDEDRPEFRQISAHLKAYAEAADMHRVFTAALRDGQLRFGPGSHDPSDPPATLPGTVYPQPPEELLQVFQTGKPKVYRPGSSGNGGFITAAAPVMDPCTGQTVLTVAMEFEVSAWQAAVRQAQWLPLLITVIPLLLLAAGCFLMKWHRGMYRFEVITCAVVILMMLTGSAGGLVYRAEKLARDDSFNALALSRAETLVKSVRGLQTRLDRPELLLETGLPACREDLTSCSSVPSKPVSSKQHNGRAALVIHPEELLNNPTRTLSGGLPDLNMNLFELRAGETPRALLDSELPADRNGRQAGLHFTLPVFAFGKLYGLSITPGSRWLAAHPLHGDLFVLLTGLTLSLLLTALLCMPHRLSARPETCTLHTQL